MNRFQDITRRSTLAGLAGLGAAAACAQQEQPAPPQPAPAPSTKEHPIWRRSGGPILRGAVIAQRRRREKVDGQAGGFGGREALLPEYTASDFDALAKTGANLVVMSFPELWTCDPPYRRDEAMAEVLGRQLDAAKAAGLFVILALRSGPGRSDFIFHRTDSGKWFPADLIVDRIWTDTEAQAAWSAMCADAAKLVADRSEVAGLTLMVEPDPNVSGVDADNKRLEVYEADAFWKRVSPTSDWRRIAKDAAKAARDVAPKLPLLISPPGFARAEYLSGMGAPPVEGCVWCVHDYEPWALTHMAKGTALPPAAQPAPLELRVASGLATAPVFLGEFGAARWSPAAQRIVEARVKECEAAGINWSIFRWPTQDAAYEKADSMFNVAMGPRDTAQDSLASTLGYFWSRNTLRPDRDVGLRPRT